MFSHGHVHVSLSFAFSLGSQRQTVDAVFVRTFHLRVEEVAVSIRLVSPRDSCVLARDQAVAGDRCAFGDVRGGAVGAVRGSAFEVGAALVPCAPFCDPRLNFLPSYLALFHLLTRGAIVLPFAVTRAGWLRRQGGKEAMALHHCLPHVAPPATQRWALCLEAALLDLCNNCILLVEFELHKLTHPSVDILDSIESGRNEFGARHSLWVVHKTKNGLSGAACAIVALFVEPYIVGAAALEVALQLASKQFEGPATFIVVTGGKA